MKPFVDTCIRFFKKETVLCVAGILAFISAFFVHPSAAYIGYIDFRVLSLLFCLMLVVAGFQSIGLFHFLGSALLTKVRTTRQLILVLSLLCFFSSMGRHTSAAPDSSCAASTTPISISGEPPLARSISRDTSAESRCASDEMVCMCSCALALTAPVPSCQSVSCA